MRYAAILNRDGGTFRTTDLVAYEKLAIRTFADVGHALDVRMVAGSQVEAELARAARRDDIDGLIAGGGDGTISTAAGIAWKTGMPLGVIPAGTMNLFARSLKMPLDINAALGVLARGRIEHADIGSADGRPFIHQFSAGMHARMVRMRNAFSFASRAGKMAASVRASIGVLLDPPRFDVAFEVDGRREHRLISAISVSNNLFGKNALLVPDEIAGGHLGFYVTDALRPLGAARLATDILRGRIADNAAVTEMKANQVELHFPKLYRKANFVLDGELMPLGQDVSLRLHPGELKVIVPA